MSFIANSKNVIRNEIKKVARRPHCLLAIRCILFQRSSEGFDLGQKTLHIRGSRVIIFLHSPEGIAQQLLSQEDLQSRRFAFRENVEGIKIKVVLLCHVRLLSWLMRRRGFAPLKEAESEGRGAAGDESEG